MTQSYNSGIKILLPSLALIFVGCSPTENHQLTMCQDVTKTLLQQNDIVWGEHRELENEEMLQVKLNFTSPTGDSMQSSCTFVADETTDQDAPGDVTYDGAPETVTINGQEVDQKRLIQAVIQATKKAIRDTAKETVKQSKALAEDASEKAKQVTEQVGEKARESAIDAASRVQRSLQN